MRGRAAASVAVLALSAAVGCSTGANSPGAGGTIIMSVAVAAPANAPIFLADELGYFKDEGLNVKVQTIANASLQLATGKIQYGAVNTTTVIPAVTQDIKLEEVCVTQVDPSYMLAVSDKAWERNDMSDSMSLKEMLTALKGEKLTAIGGRTVNPGAKLLESLLTKEGLPTDSIGILSQASSAASTAAFKNGQVGLVFQPQPVPDQVLSEVPGRIIFNTADSPLFSELDGTAWSGIGASTAYATDHPDITKKVCSAIGKANNYLDSHPEDAAKTLQKDMSSFDLDVLAKSMGTYQWAKDAAMTEEEFAKSVQVLAGLGMFDQPSADVVKKAYTADFQ